MEFPALILIGIGANLSSPLGPPRAACGAALAAMDAKSLRVVRRSKWYRSAPVPMSDQPWYVNGVAEVESTLPPIGLLAFLLDIEADFGRLRLSPNAPRTIDLDLLTFNAEIISAPDGGLQLPHPRMHNRAFVLLPLAELAPDWIHPVSGSHISDLTAALPPEQIAEPMADGAGAYGTEWLG